VQKGNSEIPSRKQPGFAESGERCSSQRCTLLEVAMNQSLIRKANEIEQTMKEWIEKANRGEVNWEEDGDKLCRDVDQFFITRSLLRQEGAWQYSGSIKHMEELLEPVQQLIARAIAAHEEGDMYAEWK